jgi:hypothetical protein
LYQGWTYSFCLQEASFGFTNKAGNMHIQAVNVTAFAQNDIIDRIMKIGADLTRSDVASILEAEKQVIAEIIAVRLLV